MTHGYQDYYDQWGRLLRPEHVILNYTQKKEMEIMTRLDAITAAVKATEERLDNVVKTVAGLKATIASLEAKIASLPADDSAELQALADELNQHVADFDTALNPPA